MIHLSNKACRFMKTGVTWFLIVGALLFLPCRSDGAIEVRTWDAAGYPGAQTTVDLWIEGNAGQAIYGYLFDLNYDPALVTFARATTSGSVSQGCGVAYNILEPGRARVAVACVTPILRSGFLCSVYLDVDPSVPLHTAMPLSLSRVLLNDGQLSATVTGSVVVFGGTATTPLTESFAFVLRSPNPSVAGSRRRWDVRGIAGDATLEVFDSRGRRVRREPVLVPGTPPSPVTWMPRDDLGRDLPAGTYFYRFGRDGQWVRGKLTFLR
jgi:hypothetical protein